MDTISLNLTAVATHPNLNVYAAIYSFARSEPEICQPFWSSRRTANRTVELRNKRFAEDNALCSIIVRCGRQSTHIFRNATDGMVVNCCVDVNRVFDTIDRACVVQLAIRAVGCLCFITSNLHTDIYGVDFKTTDARTSKENNDRYLYARCSFHRATISLACRVLLFTQD